MKEKEKKGRTLICWVYVPPSPKIFPKQNFARLFRSMTYSIVPNICQSVHSGVFGKGSNFAIFSVNRGWPLQLLYYRTTVILTHSSTPRYLNAHKTTSQGTISNVFSESIKAIHGSFFFVSYFSCSWRTLEIISLGPPCHKSEMNFDNFHIFLILSWMTLSKTCIACSINVMPYEPQSNAFPLPL